MAAEVAGLLSALFSSARPERELLADVILMTALADGHLSEAECDGLAYALQDEELLEGLDWDLVMLRAEELDRDAPLFSDTRREVAKRLKDPAIRRRAITLAARIVGGGEPLSGDERAILMSIAEGFSIPEAEAMAIIEEGIAAHRARFVRTKFNDPRTLDLVNLSDAIRGVTTDDALAVLLFKPHAIRTAISARMEDAKIESVGDRWQVGLHQLRIDANVTSNGRRWLLRCLASGEALHADEHAVIKMLVDQLEDNTQLMIVHTVALSLGDEKFLRGLDPMRVVLEEIPTD